MTFESFFSSRLDSRLRQRRLMVVYDPERWFHDSVFAMEEAHTAVVNCGGDLLVARERALESLAELGADTTCKNRLILYVPEARSLEESALCADPFAAFVAAGAVFPDGAGDDYQQLCLQFLPEQSDTINGLFAADEAPPISVINSLRSGAVDSPVLRDALSAEGPKDMLVKFLTAEGATLKQLKAASHWVKDLKDLVARTLGLKLEGPKEAVEQIQEQLWRYLLFSEFAADLPAELPAALTTVPRAGASHESFVRSLCSTLRDLGKAQPAYEQAATLVAGQLGLESLCAGIEDFGELDTFSFEERSFLRRFSSELEAGRFDDARGIVLRRQGSFWVDRDARRSAEWQLADLAARLLLELESLAGELSMKRSLDGWIAFYTSSFAKVDSLHRAMEQVAAEIAPVTPPLSGVLTQTREAHRAACDGLARKFQTEAESGWPSPSIPRAVDTFDRWVEPRWKSGERVAYFWIDALRYELALSLESGLGVTHGTKLEVVCASLPSVTAIGMASLLPGAAGQMEIGIEDGKPIPTFQGKPITGPKERGDLLAAHVGVNRAALVDLEGLANGKLPEGLESIEVLAVKTTDIDSLGENNPLYFIAMLPGILRKIQIAVNHLADAGFNRAIIASDHGFAWMFSTSAGNAVTKPPGDWKMTKERALLGSGTSDSCSLVMATSNAGIRSAHPQIAVPRGMATFTAGVTYFHGGLSPQECILPVIDVQLKPTQSQGKSQRIDVNLTYRGANSGTVTTLLPSMELSYPAADLFGPPIVRILLLATDSSGKPVGEAGSSAVVDPVSREINLERGKAIKVPLRLKEGFEGDFKVIASDPATGAAYASLKLKTDFHH